MHSDAFPTRIALDEALDIIRRVAAARRPEPERVQDPQVRRMRLDEQADGVVL